MKDLLTKLPQIIVSKEVYKELPESAGIYIYFDDEGTPIYIGKAINLKRRISSYFDLDLEVKTERMIGEATNLSYIQVASELESLLLEAKLIRTYMPKYNVIAKDDKHPLYIVITNEKYPRVLSARKLIANDYSLPTSFGPFPSSTNVRAVLKMIRKIFPYSDHKIGKSPCLYSHIGLCNPCPNEIVQSTECRVLRKKYLGNIRNVKSILDGNIGKVVKDLEKEMLEASNKQKYEEAAEIRGKIERLEYITRPQMPTEYYIENPNLYEDIRKKELKELKFIINRGCSTWKVEVLHRIECYDVAHLSGTNTTASMVTFIDGVANKNYYRHFKINQDKGASDIDSMKEVARRRVNHFSDPTSPSGLRGAGWGRPDLIIVDGGIVQVNAFTTVLYSNVVKIPVVGIAKNPNRLILGDEKIKLTGNVLNLVSRIRDETHRFARVYHHKLVSKSFLHPDVSI